MGGHLGQWVAEKAEELGLQKNPDRENEWEARFWAFQQECQRKMAVFESEKNATILELETKVVVLESERNQRLQGLEGRLAMLEVKKASLPMPSPLAFLASPWPPSSFPPSSIPLPAITGQGASGSPVPAAMEQVEAAAAVMGRGASGGPLPELEAAAQWAEPAAKRGMHAEPEPPLSATRAPVGAEGPQSPLPYAGLPPPRGVGGVQSPPFSIGMVAPPPVPPVPIPPVPASFLLPVPESMSMPPPLHTPTQVGVGGGVEAGLGRGDRSRTVGTQSGGLEEATLLVEQHGAAGAPSKGYPEKGALPREE